LTRHFRQLPEEERKSPKPIEAAPDHVPALGLKHDVAALQLIGRAFRVTPDDLWSKNQWTELRNLHEQLRLM
jgi:hypothetical protein